MGSTDPSDVERVWTFLRGDSPVAEFEQWVYASKSLEPVLGEDLYLAVIEADYQSASAVKQVRLALREWADATTSTPCDCMKLPNLGVVPMGFTEGSTLRSDTVFAHLTVLHKRGTPHWWLAMYRCGACGDRWLVGQEEHINDVFTMSRLSDEEAARIEAGDWPDTFDRYETLLQMGKDAGFSARFVDPLNSMSLAWITGDLVKERSDITVEELAALLHLDVATATEIVRSVARDQSLNIAGLMQQKRRFARRRPRKR